MISDIIHDRHFFGETRQLISACRRMPAGMLRVQDIPALPDARVGMMDQDNMAVVQAFLGEAEQRGEGFAKQLFRVRFRHQEESLFLVRMLFRPFPPLLIAPLLVFDPAFRRFIPFFLRPFDLFDDFAALPLPTLAVSRLDDPIAVFDDFRLGQIRLFQGLIGFFILHQPRLVHQLHQSQPIRQGPPLRFVGQPSYAAKIVLDLFPIGQGAGCDGQQHQRDRQDQHDRFFASHGSVSPLDFLPDRGAVRVRRPETGKVLSQGGAKQVRTAFHDHPSLPASSAALFPLFSAGDERTTR